MKLVYCKQRGKGITTVSVLKKVAVMSTSALMSMLTSTSTVSHSLLIFILFGGKGHARGAYQALRQRARERERERETETERQRQRDRDREGGGREAGRTAFKPSIKLGKNKHYFTTEASPPEA